MAITKEQRDGYTFKSKAEGRVADKKPFNCPRDECRRLTDTIDDRFIADYGVCAHCYITLVEDRKTPLIDVEYYKNRLKNRGF